nr:hypothetical protein [Tanacetum cinerariifolium]
MIGCKVMRTLMNAKFEIILILGLPCCLNSSSVRCLENVASPTSLPDSTPPTCYVKESEDFDTSGARSMSSDSIVPLLQDHLLTRTTPALVLSLRRIAHMVMRVSLMMSPSLSASIEKVAAMFDSMFRKRFRSSYKSLPSIAPLDLPSWKHSLEDEGPTAGDEGPSAGDEGGTRIPTPPSPKWSSGSLPISPKPPIIPLPISSPMISLTERTVVTFGALQRPMMELEAWAGYVDTRMADMSRAGYNDHKLVHDILVQQAAMQLELQEMRGRITALEQERDRKE